MVHGTIFIDQLSCKGCQLCVLFCPKQVIEIDESLLNAGGYHPANLVDPENHCTGCAICAVICPDVCITVLREPVPARQTERT
jgi:2-oxoglutarate ferredoxin oxidoreductase subunit delta